MLSICTDALNITNYQFHSKCAHLLMGYHIMPWLNELKQPHSSCQITTFSPVTTPSEKLNNRERQPSIFRSCTPRPLNASDSVCKAGYQNCRLCIMHGRGQGSSGTPCANLGIRDPMVLSMEIWDQPKTNMEFPIIRIMNPHIRPSNPRSPKMYRFLELGPHKTIFMILSRARGP